MAWQGRRIFPYTRLAPLHVEPSSSARPKKSGAHGENSLRLLISNVLMENQEYDRLLRRIEENDPDVILAVETDEKWARALEPLSASYPYVVRHPQENYYGLMLFSRFPLIEPKINFLVQDDIPSVHTRLQLPSGVEVVLHGIHPRPPEPIRDQKSTPRDAELVLLGRNVREEGHLPTVVAGDLNDVAWSETSQLFLRLSGLLDPRMGRGFYNSFNAKSIIQRYPLDHVFHSEHFRPVDLQVLPEIGSDHFPVLIELSCEPRAAAETETPEPEDGDHELAEEKLEEQEEAERTGDDRPRNEE
jgi:endonuclease/exonuclease/phosphatase (EEP) superfamily protein YafD